MSKIVGLSLPAFIIMKMQNNTEVSISSLRCIARTTGSAVEEFVNIATCDHMLRS